jgi:hypothetical protein|tara:strand:- start:232 stop:453 length:222 start_codon:yes stop_codon:yes gene_type:complete
MTRGEFNMKLIIEPSEYVDKHYSDYLGDRIQSAIDNNSLPIGMDIEYAEEVWRLWEERMTGEQQSKIEMLYDF